MGMSVFGRGQEHGDLAASARREHVEVQGVTREPLGVLRAAERDGGERSHRERERETSEQPGWPLEQFMPAKARQERLSAPTLDFAPYAHRHITRRGGQRLLRIRFEPTFEWVWIHLML
jgi:hypothetical protein